MYEPITAQFGSNLLSTSSILIGSWSRHVPAKNKVLHLWDQFIWDQTETTCSEGSRSGRSIHVSQNKPGEAGKDSRVRFNGAKQATWESTTKQERTMRSRSRNETQYSQFCYHQRRISWKWASSTESAIQHRHLSRSSARCEGEAEAMAGQVDVICNLTTRGHWTLHSGPLSHLLTRVTDGFPPLSFTSLRLKWPTGHDYRWLIRIQTWHLMLLRLRLTRVCVFD